MSAPAFKRQPPPIPALIFGGIMVRCVFGPLMWTMQKLGRAEKMLVAMGRRRRKQNAEENPFRGYQPGPQDVFVMTYAKSGTNWMMQIVHQLIHHGQGEFDHIHDVVPWPDAVLMSPMMGNYAVPLDRATGWQTAPER